MNFEDSLVFLLFLIAFLWGIKADIFFMIFGTVVLIYVLVLLFFMDPIEILIDTIEFVFFNPFGLLVVCVPLFFYGILQFLKYTSSKKNPE
ncbi:MAG: hypothetical protein KGD58_16475 [Candidatus Lokiarchaeota archaeon]|nr:hypothetical protein [Candidatus Lokiarchaeota archaeon]